MQTERSLQDIHNDNGFLNNNSEHRFCHISLTITMAGEWESQ